MQQRRCVQIYRTRCRRPDDRMVHIVKYYYYIYIYIINIIISDTAGTDALSILFEWKPFCEAAAKRRVQKELTKLRSGFALRKFP